MSGVSIRVGPDIRDRLNLLAMSASRTAGRRVPVREILEAALDRHLVVIGPGDMRDLLHDDVIAQVVTGILEVSDDPALTVAATSVQVRANGRDLTWPLRDRGRFRHAFNALPNGWTLDRDGIGIRR